MVLRYLLPALLLANAYSFPSSNKTITLEQRIETSRLNEYCENVQHYPFSNEEAQSFLNLAAAAYNSPGNDTNRVKCLDKAFNNFGLRTVQSQIASCDKKGNQCQAFIAKSDKQKTFVISFRGTEGFSQLVEEAEDSLRDYVAYYETLPGQNDATAFGRVNSYFKKAMDTIWDEMIVPNIQQNSGYQIYLSGHSLGGALAAMTSFKLSVLGYAKKEDIHMISFGEPRVGDYVYAQSFQCKVPYSFRVVHATDPIPHLPPMSSSHPKTNGNPYHHTQEIWYNDKFTSWTVCSQDDGEDNKCSDKDHVWNYVSGGEKEHLHYYNHFISEYGIGGCVDSASSLSITISLVFATLYALFV